MTKKEIQNGKELDEILHFAQNDS